MVSATKKPPKAGRQKSRRAPAKSRAKKSAPRVDDGLDDIASPERSAPALAEVNAEVLEFIEAVDRFKKQHGRPFPSWSEVLLIVRQLGYRRD